MEEDRFKDFVNQNREDFEIYNQDYQEIWQGIESGLQRHVPKRKWWLAAAAVFLIAFSVLGLNYRQVKSKIPSELTEAEIHYQPIIAAKMQIIQTHHQEIDALVWEDLLALDNAYEELKLDLKEQAHSEEVMYAIINNYRVKLDILNQILNEIEAKEDEKQQKSRIDAS